MAIMAQKQMNMVSCRKSGITGKCMTAKILNCTGFSGLVIHIYTMEKASYEPNCCTGIYLPLRRTLVGLVLWELVKAEI